MRGWREDIAAARGESKPENLLYIMFAYTDTSQAKGMAFLGRFLERREGRDAPTTDAARDAQYEAIVDWGIPDHAALQRLTGIESPTLVIQGDADRRSWQSGCETRTGPPGTPRTWWRSRPGRTCLRDRLRARRQRGRKPVGRVLTAPRPERDRERARGGHHGVPGRVRDQGAGRHAGV
jgi:pimeloyl-ACP methyl ester carboxylesterase